MAKFVEVHRNGEAMLLNLDMVEAVVQLNNGTTALQLTVTEVGADESYEEIKKLIGTAQGGIPMEPGRMYDGA